MSSDMKILNHDARVSWQWTIRTCSASSYYKRSM